MVAILRRQFRESNHRFYLNRARNFLRSICKGLVTPPSPSSSHRPGQMNNEQSLKPAIGAIDGCDNLLPPFCGNMSSVVLEFGFFHGMEQIALAERRPVQSIALVQNHLIRFRRTSRLLRAAHEHVDFRLIGNSLRVGDDNSRVRLRPVRRLKTVYVPSLHESSGGRTGLLAIAASSRSHSGFGPNARRASAVVIGFALAVDSCSRSFGNPSFMLWRMASATDKPVSLAVRRNSPRRSGGIASGYVSLFMEESYM